MIIKLKRDKILTPIIFTQVPWQDSNIVTIRENKEIYSSIASGDEFILSFNGDLTTSKERCETAHKQSINVYYRFYGGIMLNKARLICLIVVNSAGTEFAIVEKEFSEEYKSQFAKLKKSINMLGISSRTNLALATKEEIFTTYQDYLTPSMEDFGKEKQLLMSTEFINKLRDGRKETIGID